MKLKINKAFAASYDDRRKKEELSRLKSKYGDVHLSDEDETDKESSSSDSDIDEENILTDTRELSVLNALTSADPRIKDPQYKWYSSSDNEEDQEEKSATSDEKQKAADHQSQSKAVYLRDVERLRLLKDIKKGNDDVKIEDISEDEIEDTGDPNDFLEMKPDLMALKKAFKEAAAVNDTNSLFTLVTKKTNDSISSSDVQINQDKSKDELLLQYIKKISTNANEPKQTYNFISDSDDAESDEDEDDDDDDEKEDVEFEVDSESDDSGDIFVARSSQKEVKSHPRIIPESMRMAGDGKKKRSEKNRETRERKRQEKEAKKAQIGLDLHKTVESELQEFKRLKKEAANEKIDKIKRTAAMEEIVLDPKELEDDWDPEKHEEMVQKMFGEDYDATEVEESKPVFSDDDELDKDMVDWDEWNPNANEIDIKCEPSAYDLGDEEEDFGGTSQEMDTGRGSGSRRRRRRRRLAGFRRAMERVSASGKVGEESGRFKKEDFPEGFDDFLDKVYELDCEDVILGRGEDQEDIKCRFKYRTVEANDFGLSAEEVLSAPAKELNSWVSLKKVTQLRGREEEERDKRVFSSHRRQNQKSRLIPTVFVPVGADDKKAEDNLSKADPNQQKKKRKRNKKKKKKMDSETSKQESMPETSVNNVSEGQKPKSKKRKIRGEMERVSESRISKLVRLSK